VEKYLTVAAVAKLLGVTRQTIYNYIKGLKSYGENYTVLLPTYLPGGELRISEKNLKVFLSKNQASAKDIHSNKIINCEHKDEA